MKVGKFRKQDNTNVRATLFVKIYGIRILVSY